MKVDASALTTCDIVDGGERISLGIVAADGHRMEILVSATDAAAIAMTLPRLLRNALREKHRDSSLRYTQPLEGWQIEAASCGAHAILTLQAEGGFEASFAIPPQGCRTLASGLHEVTERRCVAANPTMN